MEKIKIAEDLDFSRITYGLMNTSQWNMNSKQLIDHIKKIMDMGIDTFDHADIYGGYICETLFGNALNYEPSLRNEMVLITKCGIQLISDNRPDNYIKHYNSTFEHIIKSAENSLEHLNTDYLDVLLFHRPDPLMRYEDIAEAFHKLHKEGKVRYFGVSNFNIQQYKTLQSYLNLNLVTNQIEISAYQLDAFYDGNIDFCMERRIAPMAWSPLAGGKIFTGTNEKSQRIHKVTNKLIDEGVAKSIDQVLLAWLLAHPSGIIPVIGTGKFDRIKSAGESLKINLSRQQWFEILEASNGSEVP